MIAAQVYPRPLRVLLVDDEMNLRNLLRQVLELGGYEVVCARSGEAALQTLDQPLDLLLTDIVLGGMSGFEVAARFREANPRGKVVVLSGWRVQAPEQELVDLMLSKPLGCTELLEALAGLWAPTQSARVTPEPLPAQATAGMPQRA